MNNIDKGTLLDKTYLECDLPEFLQKSIKEYVPIIDNRGDCYDCLIAELMSDINYAEVEKLITKEQADYLREKYL